MGLTPRELQTFQRINQKNTQHIIEIKVVNPENLCFHYYFSIEFDVFFFVHYQLFFD